MSDQESNKPVADFRVGGTISSAVWRNERVDGKRTFVYYTVTIQKRYFDKADQTWKTSYSFFPDELPRVQLALQLAYEWIMMQAADMDEEAAQVATDATAA